MTTTYIRARSGVHVLITPSSTVRDDRISYRAAGVLSRLLDNAEGFGMTAEDLARGGGREGRDAVRTALRELQSVGYIVRSANRKADGTFGGQTMYVYDTPRQDHSSREPENPRAGNPCAGNPLAEKPVLKSSSYINRVTTSDGVEAAAAVPTRVRAAAQDSHSKKGSKFVAPVIHANGIESWYESDVKDAELLAADEVDADIRDAVVAVVARGQSPVAAVVRREIKRQRAKVEADTSGRPPSRTMQGIMALDELSERINPAGRTSKTDRSRALSKDGELLLPHYQLSRAVQSMNAIDDIVGQIKAGRRGD